MYPELQVCENIMKWAEAYDKYSDIDGIEELKAGAENYYLAHDKVTEVIEDFRKNDSCSDTTFFTGQEVLEMLEGLYARI